MYQRKIDAEQEKLKNLAKQLIKDGRKRYFNCNPVKLECVDIRDQFHVIVNLFLALTLISPACSKAMLLLKKKKRQESLAEKTAQQMENMETLANDIEFAQMENQVLEGLKIGNQALKEIHKVDFEPFQ